MVTKNTSQIENIKCGDVLLVTSDEFSLNGSVSHEIVLSRLGKEVNTLVFYKDGSTSQTQWLLPSLKYWINEKEAIVLLSFGP